jgi:biopolymer transport protein ExbD
MKLPIESTEPDVRIELIPLIDVIFCILTFFMLAALTLTRQTAINVDLPTAATGTTQMRKMLIVSVDPIGQVYVDKQPVTRAQLLQGLVDYQNKNPEGLMVLYASRSASYNDVVQVLDILRSVGGNRVALATLPDSATATTPGTPGQSTNPQLPTTPGTTEQSNPFSLPDALPNNPNPLGAPGVTVPTNPPESGLPLNPNQPLSPSQIQPSSGSELLNPSPATRP